MTHLFGKFNLQLNLRAVVRALGMMLLLAVVAAKSAQTQTYKVIYNFTGGQDGAFPQAGVTLDKAGNLYGTTSGPGIHGGVYKLANKSGLWILSPLYNFTGGIDGGTPEAGVVFGPDGTLYGTARSGGDPTCGQCGVVFNLQPPVSACKTALCPWRETVLYAFQGGSDGLSPGLGDLVFDQAGAIYGTTTYGGSGCDCGTVYKLTPSGRSWTESVLYRFSDSGGSAPYGSVIFDRAGNLYSTISLDAHYDGTVFQLTRSNGTWTITTIHGFT
jgi:uncharacterized repeat protein (TIGR03803 family)